jgi:hypothetical protein
VDFTIAQGAYRTILECDGVKSYYKDTTTANNYMKLLTGLEAGDHIVTVRHNSLSQYFGNTGSTNASYYGYLKRVGGSGTEIQQLNFGKSLSSILLQNSCSNPIQEGNFSVDFGGNNYTLANSLFYRITDSPSLYVGLGYLQNVTGFGGIIRAPSYLFAIQTELSNIDDTSSLVNIEQNVFYFCYALHGSMNLNNLVNLGSNSFRKTAQDRILNITAASDTIKSISNGAFIDCYGLTGTFNLNNLQTLGTSIFSAAGRFSVDGYTTDLANSEITNIGLNVFRGINTGNGLKMLALPNNLLSMDSEIWIGCNRLNNITIPKYCTSTSTFRDCTSLETITILNEDDVITLPYTVASSFMNTPALTAIYVPTNLVDAYKTAWSDKANIIYSIPQ